MKDVTLVACAVEAIDDFATNSENYDELACIMRALTMCISEEQVQSAYDEFEEIFNDAVKAAVHFSEESANFDCDFEQIVRSEHNRIVKRFRRWCAKYVAHRCVHN